jgi:transposase-like protein
LASQLLHHLGHEKRDPAGRGSGNSRNGTSRKKLKGDFGEAEIEVPRDRNGSFQPQIVLHARRFAGFADKILSLYSRGMTTREIQEYLQEIYRVARQNGRKLAGAQAHFLAREGTAWRVALDCWFGCPQAAGR